MLRLKNNLSFLGEKINKIIVIQALRIAVQRYFPVAEWEYCDNKNSVISYNVGAEKMVLNLC